MKKLTVPHFRSVLVLAVVIVLLTLTACNGKPTWTPPPTSTPHPTATETPTPSPTPVIVAENSVLTFPDGSMIILKSGADVKISQLPNLPAEATEVSILINKGEIMAVPAIGSASWLNVTSSKGYVARVKGCAMIVTFNEVKDSFGLSCVGGECEIGKDIDHMISAANNKTWLYQGGIYFEPTNLDFEKVYKSYGAVIPACVRASEANPDATYSPQTLSPSEIPDLAATGTAACDSFHRVFPATPCPK